MSDSVLSSGRKFDQDKTRFDLLVPEFEEAIAKVMTMGAAKYEENNWQQIEPFKPRYIAALRRHLNAYQQGEIYDKESEQHHLVHAACCAMFLFWRDTKTITINYPSNSDFKEPK